MARRPRRTFTAEFKAKVVLNLLAGTTTPAEVCRKHQLSPSLVALSRISQMTLVFWHGECAGTL